MIQAVWNLERVDEPSEGRDLIQINPRSDAEAGVIDDVVEYRWIRSVVGSAAGRAAAAGGAAASRRQNHANCHIGRPVVVDAAAYYKIARQEDVVIPIAELIAELGIRRHS